MAHKKQSPALERLVKKAFPKAKPPNLQNRKGVSFFDPNKDPDSYAVYKKLLLSSGNHVAVIMIAGIILIALGFSYGTDSILPIIAGVLALWIVWRVLLLIHYFLTFRGWREKLHFPVVGWERLVNRDILRCDLCWSVVTIEVELASGGNTHQYVRAALKLFADRAEKKFYTRDTDADDAPTFDPRESWKFLSEHSEKLTIQGSANPEVIALIRKLLRGDLALINKESPDAIRKVTLTVTDQYQEVDIEIPTTAV